MKRRILSILLTICMLMSMCPTGAWAADAVEFDGGSGTSASPYEISRAEQLAYFAELVNGGQTSLCATLTADIDLSSVCGVGIGNWTPIGTYTSGSDSKPFTGAFDGGGCIVSGLYFSGGSSYRGLFGYVGSGGTVQNLTVEGDFTGGNYSGGVVGYNNGGTVQNCTYNATVDGAAAESAAWWARTAAMEP